MSLGAAGCRWLKCWGLTFPPSCCHPSLTFLTAPWVGLDLGRWEKCWRLILIPPAPGTFLQLRGHSLSEDQPLSHPKAHREAGDLQSSWHVPSSSAGSLCACSQGKQSHPCPAPAKAARQLPLPRPQEANSTGQCQALMVPHYFLVVQQGCLGLRGPWALPCLLPLRRLMTRRLIPALYQGPKSHLSEDIKQVINHTKHSWLRAGGIRLQGLLGQ